MSRSNLTTVFLAAPVMRTVERIELPSISAPKTCTRFCIVSLFILTIMLDRSRNVKGRNHKKVNYFLDSEKPSTISTPKSRGLMFYGGASGVMGGVGFFGGREMGGKPNLIRII